MPRPDLTASRCSEPELSERHADLSPDEAAECERVLREAARTRDAELPGALLTTIGIPLTRLEGLARFDANRYCRTLLAASEEAELLVVGWLPGQFSPPHDHGGTDAHACVVFVVSGWGIEELYRLTSEGTVERTGTRSLEPRCMVSNRGPDIHTLGCRADAEAPLITLHLYRPRLPREAMTSYARPSSSAAGR